MPDIVCNEHNRILTVDGKTPPHITDVIKQMGLDKYGENGFVPDPFYAERGTAVHQACKLINEGTLDEESISAEISGFVGSYRRWLAESGFVAEYSELPLFSGLHDYCGTLDIVGILPELGRAVVDIKTSASIDPAVEIQVGAQAILWNHNFQDKPVAKRYVLQLKGDGTYRFKDLSHINEFLFLDALHLWRWKQSHKRKPKLLWAA